MKWGHTHIVQVVSSENPRSIFISDSPHTSFPFLRNMELKFFILAEINLCLT
jgi:hypothetical protein